MAPHERPMGAYPVDMRALAFPTAAADAAKTVCNRIATVLDEHLRARGDLVSGAQDGWEGTYRTEFDETWSPQRARLDGLKEALHRLVGALDEAASGVTTANQQRATLRADYDATHPPVSARGPV